MPADPYVALPNSTYLDLTSYQGNGTLPTSSLLLTSYTINVALVLQRANDPTSLLNANWATRQKQLAELNGKNTLWSTYGADKQDYQKVLDSLQSLGITTFYVEGAPPNGQYVSSPESRTIWVTVDETSFTTLFGPSAALRDGGKNGLGQDVVFWEGSLSLPQTMVEAGVAGLWFDTAILSSPILANPGSGSKAHLPAGAQSPGNDVHGGEYPDDIAARYNFPFASDELWTSVQTGRIGLIEPGIGNALPATASATFDELLQHYRASAGITTPQAPVINIAAGGQQFVDKDERALDVGVVSTVNPQSQLILYAGSGHSNQAGADSFTAYQSAIWDTVNNPEVLSSSFSSYQHVSPGSPFYFAQQQLFIDAALRGITMVNAAGDGGSGSEYPNGLTNVEITHASAYSLVAGGASLSTVASAEADKTLAHIVDRAMEGHRGTIWELVSGGLTVLPSKAHSSATLVEAAWNAYHVFHGSGPNGGNVIADVYGTGGGYLNNQAGAGGVDVTQPTPTFQTAFGLFPVTSDPQAAAGRGIPDVSATSGGNMAYKVPWPDFERHGTETTNTGGTSGAAPLWASLMSQINAIFADQTLPRLGYMNDLLYTAAVIAPASFNDVRIGNNTSSAVLGGSYYVAPKSGSNPTIEITPTGYGYEAGQGYDLATGLGTPNGVLLARAMTWIAHSQMWFDGGTEVLTHEADGWRSSVKQTLLLQTTSADETAVRVLTEDGKIRFDSLASKKFAWTSQFAQQVLQSDFDPALVRMFDGRSQGALVEKTVKAGSELDVKIDGERTTTPQATLSTAYGFADFVSPTDIESSVRVARPVAIAETVGGADDQVAVVRMRQADKGELTIKFYRVDDLKGTVKGLKPGEEGYNAAANARVYETSTGKEKINGPGYGLYRERKLVDIDAGDIVAMKIKQDGHIYFAFAAANEMRAGEPVGHLWNYGVNTWGWESGYNGGDRDFNDLVVQIDFTSAYGNGWLV
ncbi:MAG TPA: hypothetical protein VFK86_08550 [Bauldia sp.]|nr:hypothetical protein [Bauldia sp.]